MAKISELVYYPVKGCRGTVVRSAEVTPAGLEHDRVFMAMGADGAFRSQRRHPMMAAIEPEVLDGGRKLRLSAPGIEDFELDVLFDGPRHPAATFTWQGKGVDQGAEAADWFSTVLGQASVLVRVSSDHDRVTNGERAGTAGFADGHAVLVTSESSLDLLSERISSRGAEPVPMDRFRANVVVSGWPEPHTEDRVRVMSAGTAEFGYAKLCVRCAVPTIDQETGRKCGPEPTRTLADYRRHPEGGVTFGMKAMVLRPGQLSLGDEVMVHSWEGTASSTEAAEPPLTATASRPAESA
ncbi:MOSC domain-containing protein [Amycolatopsis sp. cg5]|uniref:MOSC domain-containing protein n=1 Tax=Amycolatopsis sp. cg5 TaxID=3238802 RepID=UPI003525C777